MISFFTGRRLPSPLIRAKNLPNGRALIHLSMPQFGWSLSVASLLWASDIRSLLMLKLVSNLNSTLPAKMKGLPKSSTFFRAIAFRWTSKVHLLRPEDDKARSRQRFALACTHAIWPFSENQPAFAYSISRSPIQKPPIEETRLG
jgi:hypothetical protein